MIGQGLKKSLGWLTGGSQPDGGKKPGVIVTTVAEPVIRYVNVFLAEVVSKKRETTLRASQKLPSLPGRGSAPPPFAQVINRLKVLSGLDPIMYQKVVSGGFEHRMRDHSCRITATFSDSGSDPWCRVAVARGDVAHRNG
jgi:hypothetical protein